jgi:phosphatidylglycerol:prolipoprotein diacylglycerol transferase
MIPPYSGPQEFGIFGFQIHVFGALVAAGVLLGHALVIRLASERRVPEGEMRTAAAWAIGAGFVGAHIADVLLYNQHKIARDGLVTFLFVWDGISSYGGFFGALAGLAFYFARKKKPWWVHADLLVQGLVLGWLFGRLGCTITSDHMGRLTDFPLAFAYPEGARHNLGFYELLFTAAVLVPAIFFLRAREKAKGYRPGIYVAVVVALYAPARFFMDFLRATDLAGSDPRFLGLTGAQYASIVALALALWRLATLRKSGTDPDYASR